MSIEKAQELVLVDQIEPRILLVRGERVMLDADLAQLYGTSTKALNQAVKRNLDRFPADFMFQLTWEETDILRSQSVTLNAGERDPSRSQIVTLKRGQNPKYRPYAFTEHGAIMAASVLNTPRAIAVSVYVVRAFVRLRQLLGAHQELARKLEELDRKVASHDESIRTLVTAIRQLAEPPPGPKRRQIGFHAGQEGQ